MKVRTDFVTNSSSSSFAVVHITSSKIAAFLRKHLQRIRRLKKESGRNIQISIQDSQVEITADICRVYDETPQDLDSVMSGILSLVGLEPLFGYYDEDYLDSIYEEEDFEELQESIVEIDWDAQKWGLDGDNGCYNRSNYDPEVLSNLLNEIAGVKNCEVKDVTDQMFNDYVRPEVDTVTEQAIFKYQKATGKSKYYWTDTMKVEEHETYEQAYDDLEQVYESTLKKAKGMDWMRDRIFVLTGFERDIIKLYTRIIEAGGGIVKDIAVQKADYLIYPIRHFWGGGDQIMRAERLNAEGKSNIWLMTDQEFEEMLEA